MALRHEDAEFLDGALLTALIRGLLAEGEALARALDAPDVRETSRWAAAALDIRRERAPALASDVRAFETSLEMMEGTANYVARKAVGEPVAKTAERLRRAHANFVSLAGPLGTIELPNPRFARGTFVGSVAITVPAGQHPLADGIRRVTIVGIDGTPKLGRDGEQLTVEAPGVRLTLRDVEAAVDGETVSITVKKSSPR